MKKLRLLSLVLLLGALAANGMVTHEPQTHLRCDSVPQPNDLCSGPTDTGCDNYCTTQSVACNPFTYVRGNCNDVGTCVCTGIAA